MSSCGKRYDFESIGLCKSENSLRRGFVMVDDATACDKFKEDEDEQRVQVV